MRIGLKRHFGMLILDFASYARFVQKLGCVSLVRDLFCVFLPILTSSVFLGVPRLSSVFLGFPRLVFLGFPFCPLIPSISEMVSQPQFCILDLIFGSGRWFRPPKCQKTFCVCLGKGWTRICEHLLGQQHMHP